MTKYIAICTDIEDFNGNKVFNKEYSAKYPGAGWMSEFAEKISSDEYKAVMGDVALDMVNKGKCKASDILLVQELDSKHGEKLIELGVTPSILNCFESLIYARPFYNKLPELGPIFNNRIMFSGCFEEFESKGGTNYQAPFPTFFNKDVTSLHPWKEREFMSMVLSNKFIYYTSEFPHKSKKIKKYIKWFAEKLGIFTKTQRFLIENELQTKRLEAIEYFGNLNKIDLFGAGWESLNNLPAKWQKKLKKIMPKTNHRKCNYNEKINTISKYKYSICFENLVYPGYVTEKIIDCFVAGVIPIYLGAPDVEKHIPKDTFIDMRNFSSFDELNNYLNNLTEPEAQKMISSARDFLKSDKGQLYSYEGFSDFIKKLIIEQKG